jgi:2-haloacid dehalogenase
MRTYRGFLLDADNTLFDYDRAETEALDETMVVAAPLVPPERGRAAYREINAGYWKMFERGGITLADLKVARFADLFRVLEVNGDPQSASDGYLARLSRKAFFLPHAREVVQELSRRATLCLVTNGISVVQRGRLALSGIADCFSAILISEELGVAKPDRRFFQAAWEALRMPPSDLLCIGDGVIADLMGARGAGIDACWYAPSGAPWPGPAEPPDLIVRSLEQVLQYAPAVFEPHRF